MIPTGIYQDWLARKAEGRKSVALLLDPDKLTHFEAIESAELARETGTDFIFIGGSLVVSPDFDQFVQIVKQAFGGPVILFPGSYYQVSSSADGILLLSVISGRNPEMLIGRHVVAAPMLKRSRLEIMSTGYMLIESGKSTAVRYMSNTDPIPHEMDDIAACTALAGEMLGMKLIYLDAGSGAQQAVSARMIKAVAGNINVPLIVGGGIRTAEKAFDNCRAGADIVVIGNAVEKNPEIIREISAAVAAI